MSAVVVRARFTTKSLEIDAPWQIRKGDLGVLKWKSHQKHPRFLEPHVIWDRDPARQSRRVILSSITITGIENRAVRVLIRLRPR
jgi:hypothetical protein